MGFGQEAKQGWKSKGRATSAVVATLGLAWLLQACCSSGRFPSDVKGGAAVRHDERLDTWRVNGEKVCPDTIEAKDGCYVLEAKYKADYVHRRDASDATVRATSAATVFFLPLPIGAAGLTAASASKSHSAHYESDLVPFALSMNNQHWYYVTATFDGDTFKPRIVEYDANQKRTREIFPAKSFQELEQCQPGITKVLTARAESNQRVAGRESGSDDGGCSFTN